MAAAIIAARLHNQGPKESSKIAPDLMAAVNEREAEDAKHERQVLVTKASLRRINSGLRMTEEEAGQVVQKIWRGFISRARKNQLNHTSRLHLGYELHVLQQRKTRKGLFLGFVQHIFYMILLVTVFFLQHGRTVNNRYVLVETLKSYVSGLKTPSGVEFGSIGSIGDVWDWTENAFFEEFAVPDTSGRVFIRTYNQVIGSVGFTTTRVDSDSCEYRHLAWSRHMLQSRRSLLYASEFETNSSLALPSGASKCYGPTGANEPTLMSAPYGPLHDGSKWKSSSNRVGDIVYSVPLGKDPVYARRKLIELREDEFLSKETRTAQLKMAVYNNALPSLCFLSITFKVSPTGKFKSDLTIEGMNVQEYMHSDWWVQVVLEIFLLLWTLNHLFGEGRELVGLCREAGTCSGLGKYFSNAWNILDLLQCLGFIFVTCLWVFLVMDDSRNISLDTAVFVDLEDTAQLFSLYNLMFNLVILITLFAILQYTALDDRMALLTRSVFESLGDLTPFMLIFTMFVVTFGLVGHLLYGPVLVEWSTVGLAMITAIDLMMGNYVFGQLISAIGDEDVVSLLVASVFFYIYFFLMMLVVLNIVIAILMDGYASVKENQSSTIENQIKFNVEANGNVAMLAFIDQKNAVLKLWHGLSRKSHEITHTKAALTHDPWSDERWIRDLQKVVQFRKMREQTANTLRSGTLVAELKSLPSTAEHEHVSWQVMNMFQNREWQTPNNLDDPFTEPQVEGMVTQLVDYMHEQATRNRKLMQLVTEIRSEIRSVGAKRTAPPDQRAAEHPVSREGVRPSVVSDDVNKLTDS
jgi:hypothetical protein